MDRTYSTREVAQMWNVSESTVKRWADTAGLKCNRTPGGHRRFSLENIRVFQQARGFEATGLLTTEEWEDPEVEELLNRKDFARVRDEVHYLARHNQRSQIEELLKRLYLRGISLEEIYDHVIIPGCHAAREALVEGNLSSGQARLIQINLEEAVSYLFPHIIRKRHNGKISLCASADRALCTPVNAAARILEVEGWEVLNLGWSVPFSAMATMVQEEPVNLVCVISNGVAKEAARQDLRTLFEAVQDYRLPIVCLGKSLLPQADSEEAVEGFFFQNYCSFRDFIASASRNS